MGHHKLDANDKPIGSSNRNTILDTCFHAVEFPGGEITELAAITIVELMYAQCNIDGNEYLLLVLFVDHRKDDLALIIEDQSIIVKGRKTLKNLTAGWEICCKWKCGFTSWEKLSNVKELHLNQFAEYAIA